MIAPSIQTLSFLFLLVLGFVVGFSFPSTYDPDIWWHLKTGEWILTNGAVPWGDPFGNNTAELRWIAYSWLSEVVFYLLDRLDSLLGLRFLHGAVAMAMVGVLYVHARLASGKPRLALLFCALIVIPIFPWVARPQIFSFLFVAITMLLLWLSQHRDKRAWWLLVPLMTVWANLHIYFVLGLCLIWLHIAWPWATWLIAGRTQSLPPLKGLVVALLATVAPLLNPYGPALYDEAFRLMAHGASDWPSEVITELQSPNFHDWPRQVFFVWVVLIFLSFVFSGRPVSTLHVLLYIGLLYRSLQYGRDTPYFVIIMLPIAVERYAGLHNLAWQRLVSITQPLLMRLSWPRATLQWTIALVATMAMVALPLRYRFLNEMLLQQRDFTYPAAAVDYLLKNRPEGPLYNELGWGGYLIYGLAPVYRVYIDGRTQLYSRSFWESHDLVRRGRPGWEGVLEESGARVILWRKDGTLISLLRLSSTWRQVYEDADAVVFVKRNAP